MKVGLIVYGLDRPLTGISRYTLELVRALGQLQPRPDITLLAAGGIGALANDTPFPVVDLPFCRLLPNLLTVGQLILRRVAKQYELELIHDLTGVTPFGLLPNSVQKVVTIQDVFPLSIPGFSSRLDALIYKWWLPKMVPRIDQVVTASQHSKDEIVQWLGISADKIDTIPLGIAPQFTPQPCKNSVTPYILFVGNLTQRKNLARALEAFALISADFPTLQFKLVGPRTWQQTPVETIVTRLGIADRVQLLGSVVDDVLVQLYSSATLLLFPSLYEGFGLPVIEAMACGTPVITSNRSSLPEVAGNAAVLVEPYSSVAIAAALRAVLQSADYAQALSQKGLQHAQQFTWQNAAEKTAARYVVMTRCLII